MAKRFGRNQKRRMREQLEVLANLAIVQERGIRVLQAQVERTRTDALREYAGKHGFLDHAISEIGAHLGHALGERMLPHAQKLMSASVNRRREPFHLHVRTDHQDVRVMTIEGEIPSLHYCVRVHP